MAAVPQTWVLVEAVLLGLVVGSFLNVVIYRLPVMLERRWLADLALGRGETPAPAERFNLVFPPSRCPKCARGIRAWHNLPVAGWLLLRGKCASCAARISARYPLVELAGAAAAALVAWRFGASWATVAAAVLAWALLALALIDWDTQMLPDEITLPLLWLGLLANHQAFFTSLDAAVLGAASGYVAPWTLNMLFRLARGADGMGQGDFKLLAALGAWLGWQVLPAVVVVAVGAALVLGLGRTVLGRAGDARMPFGPCLAAGGFAALLAGRELMILFYGRVSG